MKHFNNLKQYCLLPLLILMAAIPAIAQPLSGTYTIGGSSPSYASLSAAVADLTSKGVSGPVTFNIRTGTYTDKALIGSITGASSTNRITFKAESGVNTDVTISNTGSSTSDDYIFKLLNANYITIRNLTLANSGVTYGNGVEIFGSSSFDSVSSCIVNLTTSASTSTYNAAIQSYGPGYGNYLSGTNNVIINNTFNNGAIGVMLYGSSSTALAPGFLVQGNTFNNPYYMASYTYYTTGLKIRNNTITMNTTYGSPYGYAAYNFYCYNDYDYSGNTITVSNKTSTVYALCNYQAIGSASNPAMRGRCSNNNVTVTGSTSTVYANYTLYGENFTFENNNLNVSSTSTIYNYNTYYCNGTTEKGNTITMSTGTGSIYDYWFYNNSSSILDSNTVNVNITGSGSHYGYAYYANNFAITRNTFNLNFTTGTMYGFYFPDQTSYNSAGGTIANNKFNITGTSGTLYGLYVPTTFNNVNVYNNVFNAAGSGTTYLHYLSSTAGTVNYYNNIFHSRSTGSTNYSFYLTPASTVNINNNIFSRSGSTGVAYYIGNATYVNSDYNLFYAPSGTIAQSSTPSYTASNTALQGWRTATGKDMNSLVYDPGYVSATDLSPDVTNANSWSRNGRGVQIDNNTKDINGNTRSTTLTGGVPDIGAYEFTPTATPPAATATPSSPTASTTQVFTLGQDTVAAIAWGSSVPGSITVRQYTGTQPPGISSISGNNMYFYTDVSIPSGTYSHTSMIYYKDPWMNSVGSEAALRLAKKDGASPWVGYTPPASTVSTTRNIITTTGSNIFGLHTGIDQGDNPVPMQLQIPLNLSVQVRNWCRLRSRTAVTTY